MKENLKNDPPLIHCKVFVTKVTNPSTGSDEYVAEYHPKTLNVTDNDTILSFKLSGNTPDDIRIESVKPVQEGNDQLSTPSISKNGKTVVLSDINTQEVTLNLQFKFGSSKPNSRVVMAPTAAITVYPEVENDPPLPPGCPVAATEARSVYPEVENDPPLPPG